MIYVITIDHKPLYLSEILRKAYRKKLHFISSFPGARCGDDHI